jgi:serine protease Do
MRHHLFTGVCLVLALGFGCTAAAEEKHGFLGVMVTEGDDGQRGVMVQNVFPDSPAAKAGVKSGDRIIKIGDQEPKDVEGFLKAIASHKPGDKVTLLVKQGDKEQSLTATLGERPEGATARREPMPSPRAAQGPAYLGVIIEPLTDDVRKETNVDAKEGVVIIEVAPNSPAEKAGLKHGDVITEVSGKAVKQPDELSDMVRQGGAGKELSLSIVRGNEKKTLKATPQSGLMGYGSPGFGQFNPQESGFTMDPSRRIRELERKVADLEKRLQEMERSRK